MADFTELFDGLNETIAKAKAEASEEETTEEAPETEENATPEASDELTKSVETLTKSVGELTEFISDEEKGLKGILKGMSERQEATVEAVGMIADRVEALEGRGAVRKSASADDGDDAGEETRSEEEIAKAGENALYKAIDSIGAEAFKGGRGVLVLQ